MPKMKTNRSARKRFRRTATGTIMRSQSGKRHILTKKTRARKRALGKTVAVHDTEQRRVRRLVPYL